MAGRRVRAHATSGDNGRRFLWRPGAEVDVGEAPFEFLNTASYLTSPVVRVQATGETIRRRLADPECPLDFPFLAEDAKTRELPSGCLDELGLLDRR